MIAESCLAVLSASSALVAALIILFIASTEYCIMHFLLDSNSGLDHSMLPTKQQTLSAELTIKPNEEYTAFGSSCLLNM